ncbi:MAG: hypothetical protein OEY48_02815, partial [Gammaproteobacteria bacterium]|nr:hypothetical protein [Gammaproteobacteria bacterium]
MTTNRLLIVVIAMVFTGCSTMQPVHQAPIEDRAAQTDPVKSSEPLLVEPTPKGSATKPDYDNKESQSKSTVPVSPSTFSATTQNAAVIALLESAQHQFQQGDLHSSQSSLQRAQRIAPQDPEVYYALANTHRGLQDYVLAEQVALKGISIVQGQSEQLSRFWNLIADIRTNAGNISGAKKARDTAKR